ncbi:hypothetical protein B0H16DRAFT_1544397 [Mycena metata]|uniref:Uncharacterized protein n=1 Tax=Mycena metata TaxID=1033252 RepID=A0AAD7NC37_9AGAR|nr:hypothetical protein B0H16DRAFT_1544397 [Mycena metata]
MARVPQELLSQIMDNQLDIRTAKSCALVCRAFLTPAQTRIFHHLDCIMAAREPFLKLHGILAESPHLITHIQSVRIRFHQTPSLHTVPVLNMLSNVRSLLLQEIFWTTQSTEVLDAIYGLCRGPNLSSLRLSQVVELSGEVISRLVASPALTHLALSSVRFANTAVVDGLSFQHKIHLTSLELTTSSINLLVPWFVEGGCLTGLRHAICSWDFRKETTLQTLLDASATSLEELQLDTTFEFTALRRPPQNLSLAGNTALRSLDVKLLLHPGTFSPWLVELIGSHSNPTTLSRIILTVILPPKPGVTDWVLFARLFNEQRFSGLQTLGLRFQRDARTSYQALKTVMADASEPFSRLELGGVFRCRGDERRNDGEDEGEGSDEAEEDEEDDESEDGEEDDEQGESGEDDEGDRDPWNI